MPPQSDGTRGFCFGGLFHTPGAWERHRFNGGAVAVCFEGCCGSMCWPRERPATHAAAGAAARGVRGDWGILLRLDWEPLRGHGLTTGVVRHACRHRVTARGVFGLGGLFCGFVGGAVAVCFEGCCGSMCCGPASARMPPRERPATHCRRGSGSAAARGVFGLGGSFHMLGSGQPTAAAGGAAARGVRGIGGFNPLRGAGAGAPIRRRHAAGATRRVLCAFCFCGGRCCRLF